MENVGYYIQEGFNKLSENSATACAAGAVIGVGVTALLSGQAAVNAQKLDKKVSRKKRFFDLVKTYAPPVISGVVTSGLIIASDRLHVKQTLEMGAIAAMWKQNYADLDRKIEEKLGTEKRDEINEEIIHEKAEKKAHEAPQTIPEDSILLWEPITEQYIVTKKVFMMNAFLDFNEVLCRNGSGFLNDLLELMGGRTDNPKGYIFGWDANNPSVSVDFNFYGVPYIRPMTEFRLNVNNHCDAYILRFNVAPREIETFPTDHDIPFD